MTIGTLSLSACKWIGLAVPVAALAASLIYSGGALAKGKPNPEPGTPADPVLAYINAKSKLEVSNIDGSANTVLPTPTTPRVPYWSPAGKGTTSEPYHIFYSNCSTITEINVAVNNNGVPTVVGDPIVFAYDVELQIDYEECVSNGLSFSPDGAFIYYGTYPWQRPAAIYRLPLNTTTGEATGNAELVTAVGGVEEYEIPWLDVSPDGNKIVFNRDLYSAPYTSSMGLVDMTQQKVNNELPVTPLVDAGAGGWMEWKPDCAFLPANGSDVVAFDYVGGISYIVLSNTGNIVGNIHELIAPNNNGFGVNEPSWSPDGNMISYFDGDGVKLYDQTALTSQLLVRHALRSKFLHTTKKACQ